MAVEVGSAFVTLVPSLRGFSAKAQSELSRSGVGTSLGRELTSGATRAGSRAGGLFSRAFSRSTRNLNFPGPSAGLLRNVRTYGYALAGVTSLTVGFGLKTASSLEQAKIAFTTMLGSARRARDFVGGLIQFAKKTPFDFPGVVSASQKLLAFGFVARRVRPTLTALGDAAAGLSLGTEGLDRLTTAVGQIQAKGKVQSDELLQLTEAGVPALKILANQFGTTTANIQDLVTKGLVPADKAIPALLKGLERGTDGLAGPTARFGGLMEKQSHTLGGVLSNLRDTVSQGLARAVKPLLPVLERGIPRAMKRLPGIFKAAGRDMAEFLHGLGVAKDKTVGASTGFEKFGAGVRGVFDAVRGTFKFIGDHATVFKVLASALIGAFVATKTLRAGLSLISLASAGGGIGAIVIGIGAIAGALIYAYKKSETFRSIVNTAFNLIQRDIGGAVFAIVHVFKFMFDSWMSVVGGIVHGAASAFGWVPKIGGKLKDAAKAFDGFKDDVDRALSGIADNAAGLGRSAGQNYASGFVKGVHDVPGPWADGFVAGANHPNTPGPWADGLIPHKKVKSAGASIPASLASGIDSGASKVGKSAQDLASKILAPLKDLIAKAKQLASSITQAILGDTGFGAIVNQTDAFGQTGFGSSVKAIIAGFVSQKKDVLKFRHQLRLLEKRGLSDAAIREIAGEGLEQGGALASTLVGATRKQLRRISNLRRGTHAGAHGIGTDLASDRFGGQIAREIQRTTRAVERAGESTELGPKTMRKLTGGLHKTEKRAKVYLDTNALDRHDGQVVASLL